MGDKTTSVLRAYLDAIGILGYTVHTSVDESGFIMAVNIPKDNGERIGILKGRTGRNMGVLRSMLRIIGPLEDIHPILVLRLTDEGTGTKHRDSAQ